MSDTEFLPAEGDLVLRDDQAEFFAILDEARKRRARGDRLRLIDSGRVTVLELEQLCLIGVEIFSSDKAGRGLADWVVLSAAAEKSGGSVAHFHHGPLAANPPAGVLSLDDLREGARLGVCLYLSNKAETRSSEDLITLAEAAGASRHRLGYYHHGTPEPRLLELARRGAWIHVSPDPQISDASMTILADVAAEAAAAGAGLVVHVERLISVAAVNDLWTAGAYILFRTPLSDYRSPFRILEEKAAGRIPDPKAAYLYSEFMR
ncbi:MAG: hypothetical protein ACYDH3_12115 [Candidatus Aminicenantales bacterium]